VFTEKTVTIPLVEIRAYPASGGAGRIPVLHVGRSRGALEYPDGIRPTIEVDAARVLELLEGETARRAAMKPGTTATPDPVKIDPDVLSHLRLTAKKQSKTSSSRLPFDGRPRICFETNGRHPGESLWIESETGDAVIESTPPDVSKTRTTKDVDAATALRWLADEGSTYYPAALIKRSGKTP
jgi:hypothetical protein